MTTETDRDLLELAAKAAGVELDYTIRPDGKCFYHSDRNALATSDGGWFAPLTDDGDALRLAVKLGMDPMRCFQIIIDGDICKTGVRHTDRGGKYDNLEEHKEDPYSATRRAIVRAAAAIGKEMKE